MAGLLERTCLLEMGERRDGQCRGGRVQDDVEILGGFEGEVVSRLVIEE